MSTSQDITYGAFLSYAHNDDEDDRITTLRLQLQAEVRMLTGLPSFRIFQDREGVGIGQQFWPLIEESIDGTLLLITMITPTFLLSESCRAEVRRFLTREKNLERDDLIIPILYVPTPGLTDADDPIARELNKRLHIEWGDLRFQDYGSNRVRMKINRIATDIEKALGRIPTSQQPLDDSPATADTELGHVELLAEAESAADYFIADMNDLTAYTNQFGSLVTEATKEMLASADRPRPSTARLMITRRLARRLEEPVVGSENTANDYLDHLGQVGAGINVLIELLPHSATTENDLASAQRLLDSLTELVDVADSSFEAIGTFRKTLAANYNLSSTLRPVLKRMAGTLDKLLSTKHEFVDWRDRLEAAVVQIETRHSDQLPG